MIQLCNIIIGITFKTNVFWADLEFYVKELLSSLQDHFALTANACGIKQSLLAITMILKNLVMIIRLGIYNFIININLAIL